MNSSLRQVGKVDNVARDSPLDGLCFNSCSFCAVESRRVCDALEGSRSPRQRHDTSRCNGGGRPAVKEHGPGNGAGEASTVAKALPQHTDSLLRRTKQILLMRRTPGFHDWEGLEGQQVMENLKTGSATLENFTRDSRLQNFFFSVPRWMGGKCLFPTRCQRLDQSGSYNFPYPCPFLKQV